MSRLTLRLPESLHRNLALQAQSEGVSLNQLIVYQLTRVTTGFDLALQRNTFNHLLNQYSPDEAEEALQDILAARTPDPALS